MRATCMSFMPIFVLLSGARGCADPYRPWGNYNPGYGGEHLGSDVVLQVPQLCGEARDYHRWLVVGDKHTE